MDARLGGAHQARTRRQRGPSVPSVDSRRSHRPRNQHGLPDECRAMLEGAGFDRESSGSRSDSGIMDPLLRQWTRVSPLKCAAFPH